MDACLYYQIQSIDEETSAVANSSSDATISHGSELVGKNFMNKFSYAFQGMSVKLMMTDPVDNYLLAPLAEAFADMVNFKDNFWFITANMVSYAGVVSALVAAKLVSYDSSTMHKLSYVMFQLRTWLDDLDGTVARSRLGIVKHESLQKTPGYVIDGVCDAIGFVAYIVGCYIFLKNTIRRQSRGPTNRYNLQSITEIKSSSPSTYIPLQQECDDHNDELNQNQPDSDREFNSVDEDDEDIHFSADGEFGYTGRNKCSGNSIAKSGSSNKDSSSIIGGIQRSFRVKRKKYSRSKIYLEKIQNGKQSSVIFYRYIKEKIKNNLSNRKLVLVTVCFLLQIAMCATFWNRYILVYKDLLESPSEEPTKIKLKVKILKSNLMYIIIWFWRLINGHSLMQMLITSVLLGKLWQFLDFVKYVGFIVIITLATITELHIIDVRNFLS